MGANVTRGGFLAGLFALPFTVGANPAPEERPTPTLSTPGGDVVEWRGGPVAVDEAAAREVTAVRLVGVDPQDLGCTYFDPSVPEIRVRSDERPTFGKVVGVGPSAREWHVRIAFEVDFEDGSILHSVSA